MIKFYCDICKKEVEEKDYFDYWGLKNKIYVCEECLKNIKKIEKKYDIKHEALKNKYKKEIQELLEGKEE